MEDLKKICLITNDVETTSILNHRLSDKTGEYVLKEGIPRLLDLYSKWNIKTTFFFTGHIAKLYPEVVRMVIPYGHEIGSHGYTHDHKHSFDLLTFEKQKQYILKSKNILEDISGERIVSFRAPALRVQKETAKALLESGFIVDSSISSQRLDMFMSFGIKNKINWIKVPRNAYFTSPKNIFKRGESDLLEVPVSALGLPYIGTLMRMSPTLNRGLRYVLHYENQITNKPIVFLTHPNEFIDEKKRRSLRAIEKRGGNFLSSFLGDTLRHKIKVKNLGKSALPIFQKELKFFKENDYTFMRVKDFYKIMDTKRKKIE